MTCAVLIMAATTSPLASQLTPAWLARCAQAATTQLSRDAAKYWGTAVDGCRVGSGPTDVQPGELAYTIVDEDADAPGAVAFHDVQGNAVPFAVLILSTCNTLDDVSNAITHELLEANGDLDCNAWCDDGQGHEWARETCDAVESNSYPIDLGDGQPPIAVSDFVLPSFFAQGGQAPFNFCATLSPATGASPSTSFATASGGYQIERDSGGNEQQVQAQQTRPAARYDGGNWINIDGTPRDARVARMRSWTSRAARRGWGPGAGRGERTVVRGYIDWDAKQREQKAAAQKSLDDTRSRAKGALESARGLLEELGQVEQSIVDRTHALEHNVLRMLQAWKAHLGRGLGDLEAVDKQLDDLKLEHRS